MMVASQMYTKLFRPWDVSSGDQTNSSAYNESSPKPYVHQTINIESDHSGNTVNKIITNNGKTKRNIVEKSNKLRKIRNRLVHQDSTISTTTEESVLDVSVKAGDELRNLEEINKRLGCPEVTSDVMKKREKPDDFRKYQLSKMLDEKKDLKCGFPSMSAQSAYAASYPEHLLNSFETLPFADPYSPTLPRYPPDMMTQMEFAQSLGIPPTDPLLLESFAQGYAMELEYARILHEENQAKLLNAKKQRPKKYKCPHCDVGFSNNGQLKGHIRIHTGERPFKCDDKNCGKTFTRNEELTRHRRIHSGLRPYPCPTCGKKFGRRDHLKKHTKTHLAQAERMMPMFVPLSALPAQYPYLYGY